MKNINTELIWSVANKFSKLFITILMRRFSISVGLLKRVLNFCLNQGSHTRVPQNDHFGLSKLEPFTSNQEFQKVRIYKDLSTAALSKNDKKITKVFQKYFGDFFYLSFDSKYLTVKVPFFSFISGRKMALWQTIFPNKSFLVRFSTCTSLWPFFGALLYIFGKSFPGHARIGHFGP